MLGPMLQKFRRWVRVALLIAAILVAPFIGYLTYRMSFRDTFDSPNPSMEPTFRQGDRLSVVKSAYGIRIPFTNSWATRSDGPRRGDVVVFPYPDGGPIFVKRVIGLPGDVVSVKDGSVTVNGRHMPIDASTEDLDGVRHPVSLDSGPGRDWGPDKVPADSYFLLGDNRGNSKDSRYLGFVRRESIFGRVTRVAGRDGVSTSLE
jgi:signal peptidase I